MVDSEFDAFADDYGALHAANISLSGEAPDYFHEYKISDARTICSALKIEAKAVLDFGAGVGNSIPWFRKHFAESALTCADVSARSVETARRRFPGNERFAVIDGRSLPFNDAEFDLAFTACVFHHIPHSEHVAWLAELRRVTRPGGALIVFEHNPWNPLTVHAVNTCPFDVDARLIAPPKLRTSVRLSGWRPRGVWHRIFFPHFLKALRPLERFLRAVPLGAQYCLIATRP